MIGTRLFRCCTALAAVLLLSGGGAVAGADATPAPTPARIGTVDLDRALNAVSDGKAAKRRLKAEFKERQGRLDRLQAELREERETLERDRGTLSPDELGRREEHYRRGFQDLQGKLVAFREAIARKEQQLTEEILRRLRQTIDRLAEEEGYALILESSQGIVLASPGATDLTDAVIRAYDGTGGKRRRGR